MNRMTNILVTLGLVLSIITLSCKKDIQPDNETALSSRHDDGRAQDMLSNKVIIEWNNVAFEAAGGAAEANPLLASRINAMMHIAIHDALNAIIPVYEQYAYHQQENCDLANPFAAVASAAHKVLKASWPDSALMLDAKLAASLSKIPDGPGKTQGIALGIASGKAILALRSGDGAYRNPIADVPVSSVPGVYNAVPPFDYMLAPFWKSIQTFSLQTHDQFRSSPRPALNSDIYTRDFHEVKRMGEINSTHRTVDQTAYAKWWYEYSDIGWNRIARVKAANSNLGLYTSARMFALLNMAMADGYIAGWDSKFYYYSWRPYTAIHAAATDGNDQTGSNSNWEPLMPTPPVPDYPSTHSVLGNAAAMVLIHFFGDNSPFSMTSTTAFPAGAVRSFKSFTQAANENANARVMAGIHFRFACEAGQMLGDKVGKWTLDNHLKPLH
jgi:PAP2 superfamily